MPSAMLVLSVCDVLVTFKNLIKGSISKDGNWIDAPLSSIINYLLLQVGKLSFTKITPNFLNIFFGLAWIWPKDTAIEMMMMLEQENGAVSEVRDGGVTTLVR